jgi:hypothetical protein
VDRFRRPVRASVERRRRSSAPPAMGEGSLYSASRREARGGDGITPQRCVAASSVVNTDGGLQLECAWDGGVPVTKRRRGPETELWLCVWMLEAASASSESAPERRIERQCSALCSDSGGGGAARADAGRRGTARARAASGGALYRAAARPFVARTPR